MQQRSTIIPMRRQEPSGPTGQVSLQSSALAYARNGWRVFPLYAIDMAGRCTCGLEDCEEPGRHPSTVHGVRDATTSEQLIMRWWRNEPTANIGIATGQGLLVIEVDPGRGGELETLQELYSLPDTALARTGGGQWHLYYTYARAHHLYTTVERLGDGVDTYADGGYVVASPSRHATGKRYTWLNSLEPVPLPSVLLPTLLSERSHNLARALCAKIEEPEIPPAEQAQEKPPDKPPSFLDTAVKRIPPGLVVKGDQRLDKLTCLAASLHKQGVCVDVMKIALMTFNRIQCHPPLATSDIQDVTELYALAEDATRSTSKGASQ